MSPAPGGVGLSALEETAMRKLILTIALGVAALGLTLATPSQAHAQRWGRWGSPAPTYSSYSYTPGYNSYYTTPSYASYASYYFPGNSFYSSPTYSSYSYTPGYN